LGWSSRIGDGDGVAMGAIHPLPDVLAGRVFSRAEALDAGMSPAMLRGSRIRRLWRDAYYVARAAPDLGARIGAARRVLPWDATVSHTTNLQLRGLTLRPDLPLHFATNEVCHARRDGVVLHRFEGYLDVEMHADLPLLPARRTFVDCGTVLTLPELVAVGDWLVASGLTSAGELTGFAAGVHFDGVQKARVAAELVRAGSESVAESLARVALVVRGLPEPEVNRDLFDDGGGFLGRGDLPFPDWMVLAEYDGWYHERDAAQRQRDILRRERLEAAGWVVVVLTSVDGRHPRRLAWRVYNALRSHGYSGPPPRLDPRFGRWLSIGEAGF
jgi:hypothetical protein